jgi:hypothetical protein
VLNEKNNIIVIYYSYTGNSKKVADEEYLLVCEYNEGGLNPNIIIFKKRNY